MKLEKAIEIGHIIVQTGEYEGDPDDSDAVKLLIEAGKRELNNRSGSKYVIVAPLKGETDAYI